MFTYGNSIMQKHNLQIFPTLVTRYKDFIAPEQATAIAELCRNSDHTRHDAWIGDATSSHHLTKNFIDTIEEKIDICKGLKDDITFMVNLYAKEYGYHKDMYIFNSWFNIQHNNSVLKMHTHPGSIFSAAFFIGADDDSSKLVFDNPNTNLFYLNAALDGSVDTGLNSYAYQAFIFKPSPGDLVLFPSWLKHGSYEEINQSNERISISFNTKFVP